ncbi:MAG: indolepyruvate ferredoxin oxidoreductase, beta subunit [Candidatus Sumerlaeota bacterium]|nr:indolepyruvate ferredoxin oxidoreductase, beta subunit [Candidatus Sumerlaeota bacterium]
MKCDLIIAGVGGQGIISIAAVLAQAAIDARLYVKQSEIHGMAQRGGAVHSHLRLSSNPIASDIIPLKSADMILSVEPMEALRYLPYLSREGWAIANATPFENIGNYPSMDTIRAAYDALPRHILFDADALAKELGSPRSMNMAMLGAASHFVEMPPEALAKAIHARFISKGERIAELNVTIFHAGREVAKKATEKSMA